MIEWIGLYNDGKSINFIAKKYKVANLAVRIFLVKNGIEVKSTKSRKYFCDPSPFESIKTKEAAYWLGFLYADGCLTKEGGVNLLLNSKDSPHLERFRDFLKSNSVIEIRRDAIRKDGEVVNMQETCKIRINDIKLYTYLDRLGCTPRKTSTLTFPTTDQVPKEFVPDFIRGIFDGDGCIYYSNGNNKKHYKYGLSFTSTESFINSLLKEIDNLISYKSCFFKHKSPGYAILTIPNLEYIKKMQYIFYSDLSQPFLKRKYEKFLEVPDSNTRMKAKESRVELFQFIKNNPNLNAHEISLFTGLNINTLHALLHCLLDSGKIKRTRNDRIYVYSEN